MDSLQRFLVDIGPLGPDKRPGRQVSVSPPRYTYAVFFGLRGFKVDNKTDQAVALMKELKIYPLDQVAHPPQMQFLNGSGQAIDTIHSDNLSFFQSLAALVNEEPADVFTPVERFYMRAIGIEYGKPFNPSDKDKALLSDAARTAAAMARANTYDSPDRGTFYYDDEKWQYLGDMPYTFVKDGVHEIDRSAYVYYMGLGNSPAMMYKNLGVGSYYLWAYKDSAGEHLQGENNYKLHIPSNIPAKDFWSVLVYDALSRSELQNGQPFPSVSKYTVPKINTDGSIDIYFGPTMPVGQDKNWIQTVPGKGWFPIFRFYGPLQPLYDKSWKLPDIVKAAQ